MAIDLTLIRNFSQIIGNVDGSGNGFRDFIYNNTTPVGSIDTLEVEYLYQSFLAPVANELANVYFYEDFKERAIDVVTLLEVDEDETYKSNLQAALFLTADQLQTKIDGLFDRHGENVNVARKDETLATGFQKFVRTAVPTVDITILSGTQISTVSSSGSPAVIFKTTADVTMYVSLASTYLNPATGLYEIQAPISAVLYGDSGNQSAGSITVLVSTINGIETTRNDNATAGGQEAEGNSAFKDRILSAIPGAELSTETGIFNTAFDEDNVSDVDVIGTGNTLMERDLGVGGKVDVYLQTNNNDIQQVTDEAHTYSGGTNDYILDNQPVELNAGYPVSIDVYDVSGNNIGSLTYTTHFTLEKDRDTSPSGPFREWSSLAQDYVSINATGHSYISGLGVATEIRVTYSYDSKILAVQEIYDDSDGHDVTMDIQVRKAKYAVLDVDLSARLLTGFTVNDVENSIATILGDVWSISERLLGDKGYQSVITQFIQANSVSIGIEYILEPLTLSLSAGNDDLGEMSATIDVNGDAQIDENEFYQIGTITVTSI